MLVSLGLPNLMAWRDESRTARGAEGALAACSHYKIAQILSGPCTRDRTPQRPVDLRAANIGLRTKLRGAGEEAEAVIAESCAYRVGASIPAGNRLIRDAGARLAWALRYARLCWLR